MFKGINNITLNAPAVAQSSELAPKTGAIPGDFAQLFAKVEEGKKADQNLMSMLKSFTQDQKLDVAVEGMPTVNMEMPSMVKLAKDEFRPETLALMPNQAFIKPAEELLQESRSGNLADVRAPLVDKEHVPSLKEEALKKKALSAAEVATAVTANSIPAQQVLPNSLMDSSNQVTVLENPVEKSAIKSTRPTSVERESKKEVKDGPMVLSRDLERLKSKMAEVEASRKQVNSSQKVEQPEPIRVESVRPQVESQVSVGRAIPKSEIEQSKGDVVKESSPEKTAFTRQKVQVQSLHPMANVEKLEKMPKMDKTSQDFLEMRTGNENLPVAQLEGQEKFGPKLLKSEDVVSHSAPSENDRQALWQLMTPQLAVPTVQTHSSVTDGVQAKFSSLPVQGTVDLTQTQGASSLIASQVRQLATRGGGEMRVRIVPESLGEMVVSVKARGKDLDVRFDVTTKEAQDLLTHSVGELRQALLASRHELGSMEVGIAHAGVSVTSGGVGNPLSWASLSNISNMESSSFKDFQQGNQNQPGFQNSQTAWQKYQEQYDAQNQSGRNWKQRWSAWEQAFA